MTPLLQVKFEKSLLFLPFLCQKYTRLEVQKVIKPLFYRRNLRSRFFAFFNPPPGFNLGWYHKINVFSRFYRKISALLSGWEGEKYLKSLLFILFVLFKVCVVQGFYRKFNAFCNFLWRYPINVMHFFFYIVKSMHVWVVGSLVVSQN